MKLHPVDLNVMNSESFQVFKGRILLLTAGDRTACNTMTIGWYQLGQLWSVPVCTVYVRPERYTYGFMESHDYFTVSLLSAAEKKTLAFCGTKSGRDVDKIKECGLTVCYGEADAPFFEEAELVLVCKKMFVQDMDDSCVTAPETILPYYGKNGGWHRIYTGQIVEAYTK